MHLIIGFLFKKKNKLSQVEYIDIFWAGFNSLSSLGINTLFKEVQAIHPCLPFPPTGTPSMSIFAGGRGAIALLNWYFHFGISGHTKGKVAELGPERGLACIQ